MFKLALKPTYKVPVTVELPGGERHVFDAVFRRLEQDAVERLHTGVAEGAVSDRELIDQVLAGWDKVQDEDGSVLEFSAGNLDRLLAVFPVQTAIVVAWVESLAGARAGNSRTPPGIGRHG